MYIRSKHKFFTDDYIRALDKLAQEEETLNLEDSDLNSTNLNAARKKRQQRKKKVFTSSSDDESNAEEFKTNKREKMYAPRLYI